jgi:hypothetical protein
MMNVELRVDIGGGDFIPHTFIVVTGPDGVERGYGLAPLEHGSLTGSGWIYDDTNHEYSASTGKIPLDVDSYARLSSYIQESISNPPPYYLPYGSQCANWAFVALTKTGIPAISSPNLSPDYFLRDLFETVAWNPYTQWVNLKLRDLFNQSRNWLDNVIEAVRNNFATASTIPSPIILDLDNDGIETTAVKTGVYFDHQNDGFAEQTGWVGGDDGLLVRDLNNNGQIDSGRELFGSETLLTNNSKAANGFEALKELDANHDGKLDAADAAFATLKIWQDADGDGYTSTGELLTLTEAGIRSIATGYTNGAATDANGNQHKQLGSYTTTTGQTRTATDVWFKTDQTYSIASDWLAIPADIAALPDATGYGKVRDLHQAMARDPSGTLKTLVTQFTQTTSASARETLLTDIIYRWTGVQDIDPASRAASMIYGNVIGDARKLEALEQFIGEEWFGVWCWGTRDPNPHGRAAPVLLQAWGELSELVYGQLMAQSHLKPLFDRIAYTWNEASQTLQGDLTQVAAQLGTALTANRTTGLAQLADFARALKGMGALSSLDTAGFQNALAPLGGDVTGTLNSAWAGLVATNGNDSLSGSGYLRGLGGNDSLTGGSGNDTLDGGSGNDSLNGGQGNDLYLMEKGGGQDTLSDSGGNDTLKLLGLNPGDLTVTQDAANLYLTLADGTRAKINGWFSNPANRFEQVQFADGTVWTTADLETRIVVPAATGAGNRGQTTFFRYLYGLASNDFIWEWAA